MNSEDSKSAGLMRACENVYCSIIALISVGISFVAVDVVENKISICGARVSVTLAYIRDKRMGTAVLVIETAVELQPCSKPLHVSDLQGCQRLGTAYLEAEAAALASCGVTSSSSQSMLLVFVFVLLL